MKNLIFIVVSLAAQFVFAAPDFIEAQMQYKVLSDGKKDFSYTWNEKEHFLQVRLGLTWQNFEDELHGQGFNLSDIADSYQVFPDAPENCSYYKAHGKVSGRTDLDNNVVYAEYKGEGCLEMLSNFSLGTFVIHFYNVGSMDGSQRRTEVVRLQLWDTAP